MMVRRPLIMNNFYLRFTRVCWLVITVSCCLNTQINAQVKTGPKPVIIEVVFPLAAKGKLLNYCTQQLIDTHSIFIWRNHLVIYGVGYQHFYDRFKAAFKNCGFKLYQQPFYHFDRNSCSNKELAARWTNIILTANLVPDAKMQRQYLDYHAHQFKNWPGVSQGFCNAKFQQVLVYKNGRQLMLVISIPQGQSLEKLNPKTTENNPQMVEWNKRMAKYQEGIPGTKKREVWVFFDELNKLKN
jgi:hypothetical protein